MQFKLWRLRPWSPSWKLLDAHFCWISFLIGLFFLTWGLFFEEGIRAITPQGCLFNHWNGIPRFDFDIHWRHRLACPSQDASHHQDMPLSLFTKGDSYKPPLQIPRQWVVPPKTWKKWWSHRRWLWTKWRNMPSKLGCGWRCFKDDLVTGSKIPSPNGEFLETSWEFIS